MDLNVTELFEAWAQERNLADAMLDQQGMAAFAIEQDITINFQAYSSPPMLTLFAIVTPLPSPVSAEDRCLILQDILAANLLWQATGGATLSLQSVDGDPGWNLVAAQNMPIHGASTASELDRIFDNLCLVSLDWKTRVENRVALSERGKFGPASPEQLISMHP